MNLKTIILIILFVWGAPSTYFRSKFRKIVYKTDDWKINIKPLFIKEIKGLIFNIYPENSKYLKIRKYYSFYLTIYLMLFVVYLCLE
jgi:peroxiredoxin Q/BCP